MTGPFPAAGTRSCGPPSWTPETALDVVPLDTSAWRHFEALPASISDPTDGLIVSTAQALRVPLVTKDARDHRCPGR